MLDWILWGCSLTNITHHCIQIEIKSYFVYQYRRTCLLNTLNKVNTKRHLGILRHRITTMKQKQKVAFVEKEWKWMENVQQIKVICNVNRKFSLSGSSFRDRLLSVAIFPLLVLHSLTKLTILYSYQVNNEPEALVKICHASSIVR